MAWWPTIPSWLYGTPKYLMFPSTKLAEMLAPGNQPTRLVQWSGSPSLGAVMRSPVRGLAGLGATGPGPVFTDPSGNPIASAVCGAPYGFTVPPYEQANGGPGQVYIIQTKNGAPQFSGMFAVPMAPYTSLCNQDVGSYQLEAFDPFTGNHIGDVAFQVVPQGTIPPTVPASVPAGGSGQTLPVQAAGSLNLNTTTLLALAAGAFLLLGRRK